MGSFFWDLVSFLWAVLNQWAALMGGLLMTLLTLFERRKGRDIPPKVYWPIIVGFISLAFFLAWRDQLNTVRDRERTISSLNASIAELSKEKEDLKGTLAYEKQQNTPNLSGEILQRITLKTSASGPPHLWLQVVIRNTGAPTIVSGWALHIKSRSLDLRIRPTYLDTDYRYTSSSKLVDLDAQFIFRKELMIYEKGAAGVQRNSEIAGWLLYTPQNITAEQLEESEDAADSEWTVSFYDVNRHEGLTTRKYRKEAGDDPPVYYPGGGQPVIQYKKRRG